MSLGGGQNTSVNVAELISPCRPWGPAWAVPDTVLKTQRLRRKEQSHRVVISVPFSGVSTLSYFIFKYIHPSAFPSSAILNTYIGASSRAREMKHSWCKISQNVTDTPPVPAGERPPDGSRVELGLVWNCHDRTFSPSGLESPQLCEGEGVASELFQKQRTEITI